MPTYIPPKLAGLYALIVSASAQVVAFVPAARPWQQVAISAGGFALGIAGLVASALHNKAVSLAPAIKAPARAAAPPAPVPPPPAPPVAPPPGWVYDATGHLVPAAAPLAGAQ